MLRKGLSLSAFFMALVACETAQASLVLFTDVYDPSDALMDRRLTTYTFTHDINDNGFKPLTDSLIAGVITLDLRDDSRTDTSETVNFNLDGQNFGTYEVNYTDFSFFVDVALLQTDGKMVVTITRKSGDFYFRDSTLRVLADRSYVPLPGDGGGLAAPEPGTVFLLGLGSASVGLLGFFRKKKESQKQKALAGPQATEH